MNRLNGTSAPGDGVRALPCSKKGGDQKKYYYNSMAPYTG